MTPIWVKLTDACGIITVSPYPDKGRAARRLSRRLVRLRKQLRATGGVISVGFRGVFVEGCHLQGIPVPERLTCSPPICEYSTGDTHERGPRR
jgi:hypothetical protein